MNTPILFPLLLKITQDIMFPCTAVKDVFNLNQTVQAHVTPETLKQCEGT